MLASGCQMDFDLTQLAVVGFAEVVPKLRDFFAVADQASEIFHRDRPDAVVLVDFPGFNWHIAKRAKKLDIPVFYYLPPQMWAWGAWRIRKIRKYVDHVICSLPFEPAWYAAHDVAVEYVGHPFFDEVHEQKLDPRFLAKWTNFDGIQVAVLPGSRNREVSNIWPMQLAAIRELAARNPKSRFLVACLRDQHCLWCRNQLTEQDRRLNIQFFVDCTSEVIEIADCALMKSGSVSLEVMARGTPTVVVYHVSRSLYSIARFLTNIKSLTLPNLMADRTVMPEFLAVGSSRHTTIEKSIAALDRLMNDEDQRKRQSQELLALSQQFAQPGASRRAAEYITKQLGLGEHGKSTVSHHPRESRAA